MFPLGKFKSWFTFIIAVRERKCDENAPRDPNSSIAVVLARGSIRPPSITSEYNPTVWNERLCRDESSRPPGPTPSTNVYGRVRLKLSDSSDFEEPTGNTCGRFQAPPAGLSPQGWTGWYYQDFVTIYYAKMTIGGELGTSDKA